MKSIRLKLWMGMMTQALIVIVLLWFFQIVFLGSFYMNIRISGVMGDTEKAAASIDLADRESYAEDLDALAYNKGLSLALYDARGVLVYETSSAVAPAQMPMMQSGVRNELNKLLRDGESFRIQIAHPRFGTRYMVVGAQVKDEGGSLNGALIAGFAVTAVDETISILKIQLLYIIVILIVVSVLISFIISRSFTRPLIEIKKVSERMASGDYSARIDEELAGKDEVGTLAASLNNLGEQLQKIEKLRRDLIANVSHELRTPLSLIRGYAETIRDVTGEDLEKRTKQLEIIVEETERLSGIVDDILNLSQIQSGYFKLDKKAVDVQELFLKLRERYSVLSEKTGIIMETEISPYENRDHAVKAEADEPRLEQILYNLINNAFDHTPHNGRILVRAEITGDRIRFSVSDSGAGIAAEEIPYIWDRYYKIHKKTGLESSFSGGLKGMTYSDGKTGAAGAGLGLAIVKELFDAHKAQYGVNSSAGKGAEFWFILKRV